MACTRSARMKERAAAAYAVKDKEVKACARADKQPETINCSGDL